MNKPKGMVFTTESVQAILAGTKSQTRRVVTPQPTASECFGICTGSTDKKNIGKVGFGKDVTVMQYVKLPCQIGDIIYVQETFSPMLDCIDGKIVKVFAYKASVDDYYKKSNLGTVIPGWKSPRYMPKEAARIFLRITDVRVERLQRISPKDLGAEGMYIPRLSEELTSQFDKFGAIYHVNEARDKYMEHWNEINGKREKGAYKWERNPFVWVYTFERVGGNNAD